MLAKSRGENRILDVRLHWTLVKAAGGLFHEISVPKLKYSRYSRSMQRFGNIAKHRKNQKLSSLWNLSLS